MRVGIDGRALRPSRPQRGVTVYLEELLRELERLYPEDEYRVLVPPARFSRLHAAGALAGRPRLDRLLGRPDLVWLPAPVPVALSDDARYVLTLHDLSFVHQPGDFSPYERLWHRLARIAALARGAARVVTVTEHVRREAIEEWGIEPERVRAVHSGPGRAVTAAGGPGSDPAPVLAVGALEPRKLPLVLVRAHELARERGLRAPLVFAGDGPLRGEVEAAGARVLGRVSDQELAAAYAGALCLACVSREEGFGFTPLEALAAAVPAVVTDLPVFTETLGDAALRVPVGDVDALAGALLQMEREPDLRARLVETGKARVRELSWERAARETRAVFEEALA